MDETLEAYASLIAAGKVRAIGASNFSAERLALSLDTAAKAGLPAYCSLQPEYNLYNRSGFEAALQPLCVERGVGVIPYFALAAGFFTGKYRSEQDFGKSARGGGMKAYLNERGHRILAALDEVGAELGATQAQVALAWLMRQPAITAPIASGTFVVDGVGHLAGRNGPLDGGEEADELLMSVTSHRGPRWHPEGQPDREPTAEAQ